MPSFQNITSLVCIYLIDSIQVYSVASLRTPCPRHRAHYSSVNRASQDPHSSAKSAYREEPSTLQKQLVRFLQENSAYAQKLDKVTIRVQIQLIRQFRRAWLLAAVCHLEDA